MGTALPAASPEASARRLRSSDPSCLRPSLGGRVTERLRSYASLRCMYLVFFIERSLWSARVVLFFFFIPWKKIGKLYVLRFVGSILVKNIRVSTGGQVLFLRPQKWSRVIAPVLLS